MLTFIAGLIIGQWVAVLVLVNYFDKRVDHIYHKLDRIP